MKSCIQCHGFVVAQWCHDPNNYLHPWQQLWRCLNCGRYVDAILVKNNQKTAKERLACQSRVRSRPTIDDTEHVLRLPQRKACNEKQNAHG